MLRRLPIAALALALAPLAAGAAPSPSDRTPQLEGYGQTPKDAQQQALENAHAWVTAYLEDRFPGIGWSPSAEYLVRIDAVHVDPPKEVNLPKLDPDHPSYEAVAHINVTDSKLAAMQEQVDEARRRSLEPVVSERHLIAGRILAALVAIFLVMAGYLRLEELTRGYYTTLLRLGAGAVLALTVLGLFLVR